MRVGHRGGAQAAWRREESRSPKRAGPRREDSRYRPEPARAARRRRVTRAEIDACEMPADLAGHFTGRAEFMRAHGIEVDRSRFAGMRRADGRLRPGANRISGTRTSASELIRPPAAAGSGSGRRRGPRSIRGSRSRRCAASGKRFAQHGRGPGVVRIVEDRQEHDLVRDVEIRVTRRQPLAVAHDLPRASAASRTVSGVPSSALISRSSRRFACRGS